MLPVMSESTETPAAVLALAERVVAPIERSAKMRADYSVESLAAVDHFISQLPAAKAEALHQTASELGCYFGEVARRALGGTWKLADEQPQSFALTFAATALTIYPVGMAIEALLGEEVPDYDGSLHVPAALQPALERALAAMGEVDEEYYYSLTGRFETVQHLCDVLCAASRAPAEPGD
jgi:hypothetical protein